MKRKSSAFIAAVLASTLGQLFLDARPAAAVLLVHEGKPRATIVVHKNASPQVRRAAGILQKYIQKSSGAWLPIATTAKGNAIMVGPLGAAGKNLDRDGFILGGVDKGTYLIGGGSDWETEIAGGSDWGTEFGVYDFLERYVGVRWLMPTELGEDVPRHRTIDVPATQIVQNPVFVSRPLSPLANLSNTDVATQWGRFNRATSRIEFHHNLLHLFPVSKFGKTHPEFYPMRNGARYIPTDPTDESWQPNFSAPGIVEAAVAQIDEFFQKNPQATSYSLGMNDSNGFDQSEASLARRNGKKNYLDMEDVSDDYFEWANAVVEKVLQKYPNKWFGTLAYHAIAEPPTRVKVHPRIVPFLTYDRMLWENPALRARGEKLSLRWAKASPVIGWYDYAYGISYQLPRVYFHRMQQYLSWGASHQVKYSYAELYPNWGEGPKPWVFTKLLWNPHQDVDALLDDWYAHYAGPKAAPELRKYYAIWEKFWSEDIYKTSWVSTTREWLPFNNASYLLNVPQSSIAGSDASLKASLKLADTPARKARVAKQMEMWEFYKASILAYQGSHWLAANAPLSEAAALVSLDKAENTIAHAHRRGQLLAKFKNDPLFALTAKYNEEYLEVAGKNLGASVLWSLLPWAGKSEKVRSRLQQMAQSPDAGAGRQARAILQYVQGKVTPVTVNDSFEEGAKGWDTWDKSTESPVFNKGTWTPSTAFTATGASSFLVQGLGRGALMQTINYQPGQYLARAKCYMPKEVKGSAANLVLQVLGAQGEVLAEQFALPTESLFLKPGSWSVIGVPFTLPEATGATPKSVRLMIVMNDFQPQGEIYLDDVGIDKLTE